MMGLKDSWYWMSWFIYSFIINTIIALICLVFVKVGCFELVNAFILFLFFFLFGLSIFSFAFFLAVFFSRARVASISGLMIYFATYFLASSLLVDPNIGEHLKNLGSFLPCVAITLGTKTLLNFEVSLYQIRKNIIF